MLTLFFFFHLFLIVLVSATDRPIIGFLLTFLNSILLGSYRCCISVVSARLFPRACGGGQPHLLYCCQALFSTVLYLIWSCQAPFSYAGFYTFYPSCSYVKWLEAAGAQVVPVIISIDDNEDLTEYFKEVIIVLNKLMFWDFKEKMGKI